MPLTFDAFKEACRERGYVDGVVDQSTYAQPQNIYAMRTKNKVKTEIKPDWYTVGFGRTEEELKLLRDEMTEKGITNISITASEFGKEIPVSNAVGKEQYYLEQLLAINK